MSEKPRWAHAITIEERRDEILRSLGGFLRDSRLASLKMQDIADRLGMTKGNLYYYFKNKQEILFHCHMKAIEISLTALDAVQDIASPAERLHALLVQHILGMTEDAYSAVLLLDLENLTPAQRRRYIGKRDNFESGVRKIIQDGIVIGEFLEQDTRLVGFAILGAINWIPKWFNPTGPLPPNKIADAFATMFVRGLLSEEARPAFLKKSSKKLLLNSPELNK